MEQRSIRKILQIDGMTCTSCEMRIENALRKLDGVLEVKAIFSSSNVYITYDANVIGLEQIIEKIEKLDYIVKNKPGAEAVTKSNVKKAADDKMSINQLLGIGIILFALYVIVKNTVGFNFIPEINQSMGYGILFFVGLLTSLHCIAMCGGINLSQCVSYKVDNGNLGKLSKLKPSLLYNSGRVISYTIIGGIVGSLGSGISFSGAAKGIVAIISGVFMVIMGLNMLNIFPWLRKLNPRMPKIFGNKIHNNNGKYGPFYVGLLNGLMPCGPLQSMQIYALGTGSFAAGALSMFMFSIGTVPLMFGFGAVSSVLSGKFTHKMMKVSAVLVIVLGVVMTNRGLALSGFSFPSVAFGANSGTQGSNVATIQNGIQIVTTNLSSGSYEPITVQKGIPVRWTIKAQKGNINGCNNEIVIPKFNTSKKLEVGDNIIEFTPTQTGTFAYSCWMGMIRSKITVVDDINNVDTSGSSGGVQKSDYKIPTDEIAVAKLDEDGKHYVEINLEENRFSPAVIVMQKGIETIWNIKGVSINDSNSTLIFPKYNAQINMQEGDNEIGLIPVGDFDFSTADNTFYGYVKVVDDINEIDIDAIKNEINQYVPTVQEFIDNSGLPSCH
ncbi:heavy metal transporter [Clostridium thermosuccinogenes]|uniref:Heavy metal transporter n=1 Tax=Clostridium thermosuccinogenes TaxID=84032 RepID=A0A2K2F905_9CLOT|nr:sulfite exporter TauE/SafE family protein [Pseudoclostridium thermosuccinogenes]PNT95227.1 heavy metal transporter [Pseudoclostridium thermosuccinogenes]PNT96139.1 heavy metal transporter [Pseudoclostridium thermosuccinogenes]